MNIVLLNGVIRLGDIAHNCSLLDGALDGALVDMMDDAAGCLVITGELFLSGGMVEGHLKNPHFKEKQAEILKTLRGKSKQGISYLVGGVGFEKKHCYNSVFFISGGKIYAQHNASVFSKHSLVAEDRFFDTGAGRTVVSYNGVRIGLCLHYELACMDTMKWYKNRCDILVTLAMQPYWMGGNVERRRLLLARHRELQTPIVYGNSLASHNGLVFGGERMVVSQGRVIAETSVADNEALVVTFEEVALLKGAATKKESKKSKEPQKLIAEEEALYRVLTLALGEAVAASGCGSVVLGVSGGIDSAVTACLAVDALGSDRVHVAYLPSRYSSDVSRNLSDTLVENLGLVKQVISIDEIHQSCEKIFINLFSGDCSDVVLENIQARIRATLLMGIANQHNAMLLATSNKTEVAMGYATMYGDTCGGFAPLGDVTKEWVYRLASYINHTQSKIPQVIPQVIPQGIISRAPTAELRPNQKDSDSLPEYEVLDSMIDALLEPGSTPETVSKKLKIPEKSIDEVWQKILAVQFKRDQAPPSPRVTRTSFAFDWRYRSRLF